MSALLSVADLGVHVSGKTCFEGFSATIFRGDRIALIGDNGSGKSSLLKALVDLGGCRIGYLPQCLEGGAGLSGGERMREALNSALADEPDLLLLDEPTNHLGPKARLWLFRFLDSWKGAAVVVSHDQDLLHHFASKIWHIEQGRVLQFRGSYAAYRSDRKLREQAEVEQLRELKKKERQRVSALQREATRKARTQKKSKKRYEKDKMTRRAKKERGESTQGRAHKQRLGEKILLPRAQRTLAPAFHLRDGGKGSLEIRDGAVGYGPEPIVKQINFDLQPGERMAIRGENGSGKTTLLRALLGDPRVRRTGEWVLPSHIGYLDQHYDFLDGSQTVWEVVRGAQPAWTPEQIRCHLNRFLFLHHASFEREVSVISEGEKARLALCRLATVAPALLILDEVTNNLDISAKTHLVEVLNAYQGTLVLVSHEESFLSEINIQRSLQIDHVDGNARIN